MNQFRNYKLTIYIDGSKDPRNGVAGFGICMEQLGVSCGVRVSDNPSVFSTELIAILSALKWFVLIQQRHWKLRGNGQRCVKMWSMTF